MGSINPLGFDIFVLICSLLVVACRLLVALLLVAFALFHGVPLRLVSDYEKKGIYINFYIDVKVLEHIYPDIDIYIFIFL
jgi:hypothetical protein